MCTSMWRISIRPTALAAGAISVQEPAQKDDTDRRAGVRDGGGTTWWIATQVGTPAR